MRALSSFFKSKHKLLRARAHTHLHLFCVCARRRRIFNHLCDLLAIAQPSLIHNQQNRADRVRHTLTSSSLENEMGKLRPPEVFAPIACVQSIACVVRAVVAERARKTPTVPCAENETLLK